MSALHANDVGVRIGRIFARYVNYLEDDAPDPAAVAYGPNLPRLREIKAKYDPGNLVRQNVNILPK